MSVQNNDNTKRRSSIWGTIATVLAVAGIAVAGLMLVPSLFGFQRYVITGGSMGDTIKRGSVAFDKAVPVSQLKVGDVITYTPPASSGHTGRVTHRIVWSGRDEAGLPAFRTKGDANQSADPWKFTLTKPTQARVAFHVPYVGYVLSALSIRSLRILLIGIPAALIALSLLINLWRQAGIEASRIEETEVAAR
jgi:signal peptidase